MDTQKKQNTHTHAGPERLCINLLHLNIQVSVPGPIAVMQYVWRISKNILFSELPPYHPTFQRERKNCPPQPQPNGGANSNPH